MKITNGIAGCFLAFFILESVGWSQSATSASEVQLGISAYKKARYEEAVWHFDKAVALEPDNNKARLYLATALATEFIPGVENPDNIATAEKAIAQFQRVLDSDADRQQKLASAKGIATLDCNLKRFEDAKKYDRIALDMDPERSGSPLFDRCGRLVALLWATHEGSHHSRHEASGAFGP